MPQDVGRETITTVVVPLDGSSEATRALRPARWLAERTGAGVVLLSTHWEDGMGAAQGYLDRHAHELDLPSVEATVVHDRSAAEAILVQSADPGAVVCMSTHGRSGLDQVVLGGVAEEVVRASDRSLLLVGPHVDTFAPLDSSEIVIGVDGSKLAETSVPVAQRWARMLDLEPVLVEVLPAGKPIVDTRRAEESAYVRALGRHLCGDRPLGWRVVHALDPADALVAEAKRGRAAMIALTSHGRSGVRRVVLGSVVARVVHDSPCPVLVTPGRPVEGRERSIDASSSG